MNAIAIRLLSQQLIRPQFSRPVDVVRHMGALQAQEYRHMRWAVGIRMKKPSMVAFRKAYDEGLIIRTHLNRGTWQLIAGEDYHWMKLLFHNKTLATLKSWMHSTRIQFDEREMPKVQDMICQTVADLGSATKDEIAQVVAGHGISIADNRLAHYLMYCETNGLICSGNLHASKPTYALVSEKVADAGVIDREEAIARLTRRYFVSHAPASLEDFVWWSGLNISDCRRGIELLGNELHRVKYEGYDFFIHEECRTRGFKPGHQLLLPAFDEYIVGYKSRNLVIDEEFMSRVLTKNGLFFPVLAYNGIICGNWKPSAKVLQTDFFSHEYNQLDYEEQWQGYLKFKSSASD